MPFGLSDRQFRKVLQAAAAEARRLATGAQAISTTRTLAFATAGLSGKASSSHTHAIADTTGLQTALDAKMRRFAGLIGDGSTTAIAVTHSLNTRDIVWQVYDAATFADTAPDSAERTDVNTLTLTFAVAPAEDALQVVVMG